MRTEFHASGSDKAYLRRYKQTIAIGAFASYLENLSLKSDVLTGSHKRKRVIVAADHRGFEYKTKIVEKFKGKYGIEVIDIGTFFRDRCDYPIKSLEIASQISQYPIVTAGIGVCGSGIGMLMPALKLHGVYGARCLTPDDAINYRKQANINMLALGADSMTLETAIATVEAWITTPFSNKGVYFDRFKEMRELEGKILSN